MPTRLGPMRSCTQAAMRRSRSTKYAAAVINPPRMMAILIPVSMRRCVILGRCSRWLLRGRSQLIHFQIDAHFGDLTHRSGEEHDFSRDVAEDLLRLIQATAAGQLPEELSFDLHTGRRSHRP